MSYDNITLELFVDLSDEQQELLCGGVGPSQTFKFGDPIPSIAALGNGPLLTGSEDFGRTANLNGTTTSGPLGSIGNSVADRSGRTTAARDLMVMPPDFELSQTGR